MDGATPPVSLLPLILDSLPGAIFWKDRQSVYLGCNQLFAAAAGLPAPAAIIGKTDFDLPWTDEQTAFFRMVDERVMSSDTPEYRIHEPITRADNTLGWIETNKVPLHAPDGTVMGILGTFVDITDQKLIDLEQQRLIAVVDNSNDFIGIATMDGQAVYVNPAGRQLVGLPDLAAVHQTQISEYFTSEDAAFVEEVIIPTVMREGRWRGDFRFRHFVTGASIPVDYSLFIIRDQATHEPIAIASITRDLTEQRQLEKDLQRAQFQEEIIKAQTMILAELSTPLIPITDEVVIMPLIGTMDTRRAQQAMETLLEGVSSTRARTVIVDITGVPVVDTQVADALLRATQAVKLLGATVILTGIRPEVAQTLVGLGVDLHTIKTYGNLQQGIAMALQQSETGAQRLRNRSR